MHDKRDKQNSPMVVGIWFGYPHQVGTKREGIVRYALYLAKSLVIRFNIQIEVWCYEVNRAGFESLFSELLESGNVRVLTEKIVAPQELCADTKKDGIEYSHLIEESFFEKRVKRFIIESQESKSIFRIRLSLLVFELFRLFKRIKPLIWGNSIVLFLLIALMLLVFLVSIGVGAVGVISSFILLAFVLGIFFTYDLFARMSKRFARNDTLASEANRRSKASCFLVPHVSLLNAKTLAAPRLIAVHDLVTIPFASDFLEAGHNFSSLMEGNCEILNGLHLFAKRGDHFVSNSKYVMESHVLRYIPEIKPQQCHFVNLPVNVPSVEDIYVNLEEKYKLNKPFLFYPTQVRPYKNVELLVDAFSILLDRGMDIQLVLTASNIKYFPSLAKKIDEKVSPGRIIVTGDVSEGELIYLHKNAAAVVAPSRFEGGIPWPALEAFYVGTPAVLCKTPQTVERLAFAGVDLEESGVPLADSGSAVDLADKIMLTLENRELLALRQKETSRKISEYDWDAAGDLYMNLFMLISKCKS